MLSTLGLITNVLKFGSVLSVPSIKNKFEPSRFPLTLIAEESVPRSVDCLLPGGAGVTPGASNASCRN